MEFKLEISGSRIYCIERVNSQLQQRAVTNGIAMLFNYKRVQMIKLVFMSKCINLLSYLLLTFILFFLILESEWSNFDFLFLLYYVRFHIMRYKKWDLGVVECGSHLNAKKMNRKFHVKKLPLYYYLNEKVFKKSQGWALELRDFFRVFIYGGNAPIM